MAGAPSARFTSGRWERRPRSRARGGGADFLGEEGEHLLVVAGVLAAVGHAVIRELPRFLFPPVLSKEVNRASSAATRSKPLSLDRLAFRGIASAYSPGLMERPV